MHGRSCSSAIGLAPANRDALANWGPLCGAAALACYLIVALVPFRWDPPQIRPNGARPTHRGIVLPTPGLAYTDASWLAAARAQQRASFHLRIRSESTEQGGPARIFTVSLDNDRRNLTIGQEGNDLVIRLLRPGSNYNGTPPFVVSQVFNEPPRWLNVDLFLEKRALTLRIDGVQVLRTVLPAGTLARWSSYFPVVLGNETTGERPWRGEIARADVLVGNRRYDCLAPWALHIPRRYAVGLNVRPVIWRVPSFDFRDRYFRDGLLNFLCFIPCGYLLTIGRWRRSFFWAILICTAMSAAVEGAQLFFAPRVTSMGDWLLNTSGAAAGAFLAGPLTKAKGKMERQKMLVTKRSARLP